MSLLFCQSPILQAAMQATTQASDELQFQHPETFRRLTPEITSYIHSEIN